MLAQSSASDLQQAMLATVHGLRRAQLTRWDFRSCHPVGSLKALRLQQGSRVTLQRGLDLAVGACRRG